MNGNRINQTNSELGITDRTFTHSIEDHTLTAGDITYEFDDDDNLASRTEGTETTDYSYSSTGELLSVTLPDDTEITYVNDPSGRRIAKLVDGVIEEKYLWSGFTTLLAVYDGADNLTQRFIYGDSRMPVAMTMDGDTYYLAYDQVGTIRVVTDSSGNVVKQLDYDSFGNLTNDSNPALSIPFGFAGGLYDPDTGLVRFGYRDYMPEIGKWTAKDPIGFDGGDSNLYGYVQNDPVNLIDPLGLYSFDEFLMDASNFSAGFGDTITFGATAWIRDKWDEAAGLTDVVDPCSGAYTAGKWSGYAWEIGFGAETLRGARWMKNAKGFEKAWSKDFRTGWHRLPKGNYPGAGKNLPHYHRRPGIGKHRPWQGGW